jgi:hypothetical protein
VGSWTSQVVVAMKERKRVKAGEQMLMLFRMFNPQLTSGDGGSISYSNGMDAVVVG